MAAPDNWLVLLAVGIGGPLVGGLVTYLGTRTTARPSEEQSLTERFKALVDRQEVERQTLEAARAKLELDVMKLERVAEDLEIMVVRLMAWSEQVTAAAEREGWDLPERPKFRHVS